MKPRSRARRAGARRLCGSSKTPGPRGFLEPHELTTLLDVARRTRRRGTRCRRAARGVLGRDPHRIALITRARPDLLRQRGGEHQRPALVGCRIEENSRSSRKPRSSISSASSSTTAFQSRELQRPRWRWSRKRPGVPTTIWAPRGASALPPTPCRRHTGRPGCRPGIEPRAPASPGARVHAWGRRRAQEARRATRKSASPSRVGGMRGRTPRSCRSRCAPRPEIATVGVGLKDGKLDGGRCV